MAIRAPSGFGKSVLAIEIADALGLPTVLLELTSRIGADRDLFNAALRRSLRAAGLRSLADSPEWFVDLLEERDDPVLVIVDESQLATGSGQVALTNMAAALPAPHRLILAGQSIQAGLKLDLEIGPDDLRFSPEDVMELARQARRPVDQTDAAAILSATDGWPAAAALAIGAGVTEPRGLPELVAHVLAAAEPATRAATSVLASLPLLSEAVAEAAAGPGALKRLQSTGIPLRTRPDGWLVMPDPIRESVAPAELDRDQLAAAADAYFDANQGQVALSMLLGHSAFEAVAETLERRRWQELQEFDPVELRSVLSILPTAVIDSHPRLLLVIARAANAAGELRWRGSLLERASQSPAIADDPVLARQIDADRAQVAAIHGDVETTTRLADGVLSAAASDETATRARALAAFGRVRAFEREPATMAQARQHLSDAAMLARLANEPELVATTLSALGYNVFYAAGELESARKSVQEAADAAPIGGRARAGILTFLSDVLMYSGELDEAEAVLREVADVGHRLRDDGLLGYHDWMRASIASRRGDVVALTTWLADAERHPGDWFAHPTGIEFMAEAVDFYGRVGEHDRASRYLARVSERVAADEHEDVDQIELYARGVYGARSGDPVAAESDLAAVLETEQLPPREAWRMHLLRGLAALRAGDEKAAADHAARAFEEAAALGHPELPSIHEPAAVEMLLPLARRTRSEGAETVAGAEPVLAVRLLGGFSVTAAGRPADPPPGRPALLVKLLALSGRPIAVDEAVEALWPEVDPDTGRARLRNVLARTRASSGEVIRRDGDALVLASGVAVDALDFDRDARAALAAGNEGAALAQRALSRYTGELLPGDRYEDFTVVPRERLELLYLSLLDRLAQEADRSGDVDEALRMYSEAIGAAPLEEHRYEAAAELALKNGRRQRAREIVDQADRMLADLGVERSPALSRIASSLNAG